jgi:acetyl-CoA carboxylase carboxyltransferase component
VSALLATFAEQKLIEPTVLEESDGPAERAAEAELQPRSLVDSLLDSGSLVADGPDHEHVVAGAGTVAGRPVAVVALEADLGGALSHPRVPRLLERIYRTQRRARALQCPIVYVFGAAAASRRPAGPALDAEDEATLFSGPHGFGRLQRNMARLSGVIPQIGLVVGTAKMPLSFPTALCDVLILLEERAFLALGDPPLVKRWLGRDLPRAELGGARLHMERSGLADAIGRSSAECFDAVGRYVALLADRGERAPARPPVASSTQSLETLIPDDPARGFDVRDLVRGIVDDGTYLEPKEAFARELTTVLARLDGWPIGIIANNSAFLGGALTVQAAAKATRFMAVCDSYGLPVLFLADTPGFVIGPEAEAAGIERAGARMFAAIARLRVPKISVVIRKAYSAGLWAMAGPAFEPDAFLALPNAAVTVSTGRISARDAAAAERDCTDEGDRTVLTAFKHAVRMPKDTRELVDRFMNVTDLRAELAARLSALPKDRSRRPKRKGRNPIISA